MKYILLILLLPSIAQANGIKFPGFIVNGNSATISPLAGEGDSSSRLLHRTPSLNGGNSTSDSFESRQLKATSRGRVQIAVRGVRPIDEDRAVGDRLLRFNTMAISNQWGDYAKR